MNDPVPLKSYSSEGVLNTFEVGSVCKLNCCTDFHHIFNPVHMPHTDRCSCVTFTFYFHLLTSSLHMVACRISQSSCTHVCWEEGHGYACIYSPTMFTILYVPLCFCLILMAPVCMYSALSLASVEEWDFINLIHHHLLFLNMLLAE